MTGARFGHPIFSKVLLEATEELKSELFVSYLASAETNCCLDLVSILQDLPGVLHLKIVVVIIGHRSELNLFDLDHRLLPLGFVGLLFLFVLILSEIDDAADWRISLGSNLDQVISTLSGEVGCVLWGHNAELPPLFIDYSDLAGTNALIGTNLRCPRITPRPATKTTTRRTSINNLTSKFSW